MKFKVVIGIACVVVVLLAGILGRNVAFALQWPLFEALRTTASIIFAVVGAWFAIIYPERLKKSFRGGTTDSNGQGIHRLFTPIVHSTAILATVLIIGVVAPLLKQFDWILSHKDIFRGISYGLLVFLTLWQLATVLFSLIGPDMVKRYVSRQDRAEEAAQAVMPSRKDNSHQ
jgi:ABC-type nickel/cobalt efflux system permease component RcnA